jgi:hypothetical protein
MKHRSRRLKLLTMRISSEILTDGGPSPSLCGESVLNPTKDMEDARI